MEIKATSASTKCMLSHSPAQRKSHRDVQTQKGFNFNNVVWPNTISVFRQ